MAGHININLPFACPINCVRYNCVTEGAYIHVNCVVEFVSFSMC